MIMNKLLLLLLFGLVLSSSVFATATFVLPADFRNGLPGDGVSTDMRFDTSFTLRNNDGSAIGSGAICSGSTVRLTPSTTALWGALNQISQVTYYECDPSRYCPRMVSSTSRTNNARINWIASSYFDNVLSYSRSNDFATGIATDSRLSPTGSISATGITAYNSLGSFVNNPVTYILTDGSEFPDMEAGMNLFCKGDLQVLVDGRVVLTRAMPVSGDLSFSVPSTTNSTSTITTRLVNMDCLAAVVKHPLDLDHPEAFMLSFYPTGRPTFSSSGVGSTSSIVPVANSEGMCSFTTGTIRTSATTRTDGQTIMQLIIPVTNSGDSLAISTVSTSDSGFSVAPFPEGSDCAMLYGTLCPTDNGFGTTIPRGGSLSVYVLGVPGSSAPSTVTVTLEGQTTTSSCGGTGGARCSQDIPVSTGRGVLSSCTVSTVPPTTDTVYVGARENAVFSVECRDAFGSTISCPTGTWSWSSNVGGRIVSVSGQTVIGQVGTTTAGLIGSITYSSGGVSCSRGIITRGQPRYGCTFDPSSARLNVTGSQYFNTICVDNDAGGRRVTVDAGADYRTGPGLVGTLSDPSGGGVNFTAGAVASGGDLQGNVSYHATLTDPSRPYINSVDIVPAPIVVVNPTIMCMNDSQCPTGQVCRDGRCVAQCTDSTMCPPGFMCVDRQCINVCPAGTVRVTLPDGSTTCRSCPDPMIVCPAGSTPLCLADGSTICQCNPGTIVCPGGFVANCPAGGPPTCIRNPGDERNDSSQYCTIGNRGEGPITVQNGTSRVFTIRCGAEAQIPCTSVSWSISGPGVITSSSTNYASVTVNGPVGTSGQIQAFVDGDINHACYKEFNIGQQLACIRVS